MQQRTGLTCADIIERRIQKIFNFSFFGVDSTADNNYTVTGSASYPTNWFSVRRY